MTDREMRASAFRELIERKTAFISLLTDRQQDVYHLALLGYANSRIASVLGISTRTVEKHRAAIAEKVRNANV
jgi:FixJ family two-component response regulator